MPENPIRGFINRVTGQTARNAALTEQHRQYEATQLAQARIKADAIRTQFQQVARIDRPQLPDNPDYETEVAEIVAGVKARSYYGKFPHGMKINGEQVGHGPDWGYATYGDSKTLPIDDLQGQFDNYMYPLHIFEIFAHQDSLGSEERTLRRKLNSPHFIVGLNTPDGENTIISYQLKNHFRDASGRLSEVLTMNFLLSRTHASRLLALARKKPEVAETFLQNAAQGFEGNPGVSRYQSDRILIVNLDKLNPDYFNSYIDPYTGALRPTPMVEGNFARAMGEKLLQDMIENKNGEVDVLKYTTPHDVA